MLDLTFFIRKKKIKEIDIKKFTIINTNQLFFVDHNIGIKLFRQKQ